MSCFQTQRVPKGHVLLWFGAELGSGCDVFPEGSSTVALKYKSLHTKTSQITTNKAKKHHRSQLTKLNKELKKQDFSH